MELAKAAYDDCPEVETLSISPLPLDVGKVAIRGTDGSIVWVPETMGRVERWQVSNGTHPDYPKE